MIDSPFLTQSIVNPVIVRMGHLAEKIVIVDGQAGCGKTLFSPIVAAMDRVELINYAFEVEFICRLFNLHKIQEDAAVSMVRMLTDHKLYQTMMGRETNFRYSDVSSVFNDSNPWRYFRRIFQKGDMSVPARIKTEKPILSLTTHDLLSMSSPVFKALEERLVLIEVVRHPLYMLIQQTLNMERLLDDPRDIQINIKYRKKQLPYFAFGWEEKFDQSNPLDKAIFSTYHASKLTNTFKHNHPDLIKEKILTIPFEPFVLDPWPFLARIEDLLSSKITTITKKMIKKNNVPRKKICDGIPLAIYKRCGWEPPVKGFSEKDELNKRRQFAVNQGASKEALELLDEMSDQYEDQYLKGII